METCIQCGTRFERDQGWFHQGQRFCSVACTRAWDEATARAIVEGRVPGIDDKRRRHAAAFGERWSAAVETIIAAGEALVAAKADLGHGLFEAFVARDTAISSRTARCLMSIYQSSNIRHLQAKRQHVAVLPPSWGTLYDLAVLPKSDFEGLLEGGHIHSDMQRRDIRTAVAALTRPDTTAALTAQAATAPGAARYGAILADPPWRFETRGRGGDRMADHHYPTMPFDDICALPVADLAARDCALFLWITPESLMRGQDVMRAWGFEYRTVAFVWRKTSGPMGLGYWTRKQTELCLLGVRGRPSRQGRDFEDIIEAPRAAHSQKPPETHARIQRIVNGPYIELFARQPREGWDSWGNEPGLRVAE